MDLLRHYSDIADQYPEHITKLQLCEICGISKSTAYKLLKQGILPHEECNEGLLHYYRIPLIEVLRYKDQKENDGKLTETEIDNARSYYKTILLKYDDALSIFDIHLITGYGKETIRKWIINGYIFAVKVREGFKIPQNDVIAFLTSRRYDSICRKTEKHENDIETIRKAQNNKLVGVD